MSETAGLQSAADFRVKAFTFISESEMLQTLAGTCAGTRCCMSFTAATIKTQRLRHMHAVSGTVMNVSVIKRLPGLLEPVMT